MKKGRRGLVLVIVLFGMYLAALVSLLFFGGRQPWPDVSLVEYTLSMSNFVPLETISEYVAAIFTGSMNRAIPIRNLLGNLLLFFPMGLFLPTLLPGTRGTGRFSASILGLLLAVEAAQLLTRLGSFDVDDLLLNFAGAWMGFRLWGSQWAQGLLKKFKLC